MDSGRSGTSLLEVQKTMARAREVHFNPPFRLNHHGCRATTSSLKRMSTDDAMGSDEGWKQVRNCEGMEFWWYRARDRKSITEGKSQVDVEIQDAHNIEEEVATS